MLKTIAALLLICVCLASCEQVQDIETSAETEKTTAFETTANVTAAEESYINDTPSDVVSIDVLADELYDTMERIEEAENFPSDIYRINLLGFSVPVTLTMQLDSVVAFSAYGQTATLSEPRDIYGNCRFDIFEYDGAVILEGGSYAYYDIYVLSPSGTDEVHRGEEATYYLYLNEEGRLYYHLTHNEIAAITQTGALSVARGYDEFWYAEGYVSIEDGKLIFEEPYESHILAEKYDFEAEFEQIYSKYYCSIEEVFEANKNSY